MSERNDESMLAPYRVLDLSDEKGWYCGNLLGSLGADVIKVEPPGGDPGRLHGPFLKDLAGPETGLPWLAYNANKRGITLDIESPAGRDTLLGLVRGSDVLVETYRPGFLDQLGLGHASLENVNPGIVVASITPFGQTGPYRNFKGSDIVCWALGGLLAQTGDPDRPPMRISHINFSYLMASLDAAWGIMAALWWRVGSGLGQHVDVSIQDSMAKTTFLAHEMWEVTGTERQRGSTYYTIPWSTKKIRTVWRLKDGYMYKMFSTGEFGARENPHLVKWMEEEGMADAFLTGLNWAQLDWRNKTQDEICDIEGRFERFFATKTKAEMMAGSFSRGLTLQPIYSPQDILEHPQLAARDYWRDIHDAVRRAAVRYPDRFCLPSTTSCRVWRTAPGIGQHNAEVLGQQDRTPAGAGPVPAEATWGRALEGIKVVAFEHAQAIPMATMAMALYGATVVRVETATRLDWQRQAGPFINNVSLPDRSAPYLFINAGKHGVTVNLRKPQGIEVAKRLAAWADVVVENFAGGVMRRLGLGYDDLTKVNPDLIMLSAGIYGQTGPMTRGRGHGGQLTALTGMPHLTGFPDQPPQFPGHALTDFTAPRASVLAILAGLDYRRRTGKGQYLDASQFEATVHFLSPVMLQYTANGVQAARAGNDSDIAAPHGVYPCTGKDRWCAISAGTDQEWRSLCRVMGSPAWCRQGKFATQAARRQNALEMDRLIGEWTAAYSPDEVMRNLQDAGVPAGSVHKGQDLHNDAQLAHRHFYWKLEHPGDIGTFTYSGNVPRLSRTPYHLTRAPMLGEHNAYVFTQLLGMTDEEFVRLTEEGVLE